MCLSVSNQLIPMEVAINVCLRFRCVQTIGVLKLLHAQVADSSEMLPRPETRWRCLCRSTYLAAEGAATNVVPHAGIHSDSPCMIACQAAMLLGWPNRNRWASPPPSLLLRCCCELPQLLCGWVPAAADGHPLGCRCHIHTPASVPAFRLTACALDRACDADGLVCTWNQST